MVMSACASARSKVHHHTMQSRVCVSSTLVRNAAAHEASVTTGAKPTAQQTFL